jgi:hypothetical protein
MFLVTEKLFLSNQACADKKRAHPVYRFTPSWCNTTPRLQMNLEVLVRCSSLSSPVPCVRDGYCWDALFPTCSGRDRIATTSAARCAHIRPGAWEAARGLDMGIAEHRFVRVEDSTKLTIRYSTPLHSCCLRAPPRRSTNMPNAIRQDITTIDETSFPYVFEQNATITLKDASGLVRCNVYRPKDGAGKWPVLMTYGPYGKDIPYQE